MTPSRKMKWRACHTAPERGIAFFDNIVIETDSITDSRWDRVLPVLVEEQVAMCRLMRRLLKERSSKGAPAPLVLDVGTGSGVFAIYLAKLGCRVIAIESSWRACLCAQHNATQNGVRLAGAPESVQRGELFVQHGTFDKHLPQERKFDMVVLSPPYNPTHPSLSDRVAAHASAGDIGMTSFLQQIEIVPGILAIGGVCVGNQMTPTVLPEGDIDAAAAVQMNCAALLRSAPNAFAAIASIGRSFKGTCEVRAVPLLRALAPTQHFLEQQYSTIKGGLAHPNFDKWCGDVAKANPLLALLYYEVRCSRSTGHCVTVEDLGQVFASAKDDVHERLWTDRILLHRQIVEHASPPLVSPLGSFLVGRVSGALEPQWRPSVNKAPYQDSERLNDSLLGIMDAALAEHVRRQHTDEEHLTCVPMSEYGRPSDIGRIGGGQFGLIIADTAPIYPAAGATRLLKNELKLWDGFRNPLRAWPSPFGAERSEARPVGNTCAKRIKLRRAILKCWQNTTKELQRARCGPFAHPFFTGSAPAISQWKWPEIVVATLSEFKPLFDALTAAGGHEPQKGAESILMAHLSSVHQALANENTIASDDGDDGYWPEWGYSRLQLAEELRVEDGVAQLESMAARLGTALGGDVHINDVAPEVMRRDLHACQLIMHFTLRNRLENVLVEHYPSRAADVRQALDQSILIGAPLGLFYHRHIIESDSDLSWPAHYMGGFWLLFVPPWDDCPAGEQMYHSYSQAYNLARLAWLLHVGSYSAERESYIRELGAQDEATISAHQARNLVATLMDDAGLSPKSKQILWHIDAVMSVWTKSVRLGDEIPLDHHVAFTELHSLPNTGYVDALVNLALGHAWRRARQPPSPTDALGHKAKTFADTVGSMEAADAMRERVGFQCSIEAAPAFLRSAGFAVAFHHCMWSSAYHALRASLASQGATPCQLRVEITNVAVTIYNRVSGTEDGRRITAASDRAFWRKLEGKLGTLIIEALEPSDPAWVACNIRSRSREKGE